MPQQSVSYGGVVGVIEVISCKVANLWLYSVAVNIALFK